jgi:hypothetical protein
MGGDSKTPSPDFFIGPRRETFLALADRIAPACAGRPEEGPAYAGEPGAKSDATVAVAELFLASQDEGTRSKLRLLLKVFEWGAAFRFGRRFTRLPAATQDAYMQAWERSPIQLFRFGFSSLRNLVLLSFYTRPESWPMLGYPGPVLETNSSRP